MSTPTIEAAHAMGAKGGPVVEAERLAFEAWMAGHCWALGATWDGKQYIGEAEKFGDLSPRAMMTRQLWAAWRDRAALSQQPATPEPVAWMLPRDGDDCAVFREPQDYPFAATGWTPLYTHPAPNVPGDVVRDAAHMRFVLAAADDMTTSRYKSLCELLSVAVTEDFDLSAAISAMLAAKEGGAV